MQELSSLKSVFFIMNVKSIIFTLHINYQDDKLYT